MYRDLRPPDIRLEPCTNPDTHHNHATELYELHPDISRNLDDFM